MKYNYEKLREKLGLSKDELHDMVKQWKLGKWKLFKFYFPKPRLVYDVETWDEARFKDFMDFFKSLGLEVARFSFQEWKEGKTMDGQKLGKLLAKELEGEKKERFLKAWDDFRKQVFLKGKLVISVHPFDLAFISDPCSWKSCHSLGHDHFKGNFSYVCDLTTFVIFFTNKDDQDFGAPKKLWRVLGYFLEDYPLLILSRQYPYDCDNLFNLAKEKVLEIFFKEREKVHSFRPSSFYLDVEAWLEDEGRTFLPYFDQASFKFYGLEVFEEVVFSYTSRIMNTSLASFWAEEELVGYCDFCGRELHEEDDFMSLEDGSLACETCLERYFTTCEACESLIYLEERDFEQDELGHVLCSSCAQERKRLLCDFCHREVFEDFLHLVHERQACELCVHEVRAFLKMSFLALPFFEGREQEDFEASLLNLTSLW